MSRIEKQTIKNLQAMDNKAQLKTIQASNVEGVTFEITMDSFLDGTALTNVQGLNNDYKSFSKQVTDTYKKYNGDSDYGCPQVRTIIDTRSAFIAGELLSVTGDKLTKKHGEFITKFLDKNKLTSTRLFSLTKRLEMVGKAFTFLNSGKKDEDLIPYFGVYNENNLFVELEDHYFPEGKRKYYALKEGGSLENKEEIKVKYPVLIVTGGTGDNLNNTTTKVGLVLNECDNYDRAGKNIREINQNAARVTPTFKTTDRSETSQLINWLKGGGKGKPWKRTDAFVGTADLNYKSPTNTSVTMLLDEQKTLIKTITGATGVPVHWFGHVDMMSNRATAEELYQFVYNSTRNEVLAIEASFKEILINAQKMYIDETGGDLISTVVEDIQVKLPLIDFGRFRDMIMSYSQLYNDEAISLETYRNNVPGIDPIFEAMMDKKKEKLVLKSKVLDPRLNLGSEETNEPTDTKVSEDKEGDTNE